MEWKGAVRETDFGAGQGPGKDKKKKERKQKGVEWAVATQTWGRLKVSSLALPFSFSCRRHQGNRSIRPWPQPIDLKLPKALFQSALSLHHHLDFSHSRSNQKVSANAKYKRFFFLQTTAVYRICSHIHSGCYGNKVSMHYTVSSADLLVFVHVVDLVEIADIIGHHRLNKTQQLFLLGAVSFDRWEHKNHMIKNHTTNIWAMV